jgi:hypothetical protein
LYPGGAKDGAFDGDLCDIELVSLTERARVLQSGGCGGRGFLIDCLAGERHGAPTGRPDITRRICFNDQWVHHSALTARRHLR